MIRWSAKLIEKTIESKGDLFQRDKDGMTAFMWPILNGNAALALEVIKSLDPQDVDHRSKDGSTTLMYASCFAMTGYDRIVLELISKGADVNARNSNNTTPLMRAAFAGNQEIIRILLDNDANPAAVDKQNYDAREYVRMSYRSNYLSNYLTETDRDEIINLLEKGKGQDAEAPKPTLLEKEELRRTRRGGMNDRWSLGS